MNDRKRLDLNHRFYYVELKSTGHTPLFAHRNSFLFVTQWLRSTLTNQAEKQHTSDARLIAYCLLPHKVFLLLRSGSRLLKDTLHDLMDQHARYHNEHWPSAGHLYHKHSHTLLLEPNRYLIPTIQHIHQQPVASNLVANAAIYPWSSAQSFAGETPTDGLDISAVQQYTGKSINVSTRRKRFWCSPPTKQLDWDQGNQRSVWALASHTYLQQVNPELAAQDPIDASSKPMTPPSLDWVVDWCCNAFCISHYDLTLKMAARQLLEHKAITAYLAQNLCDAQLSDATLTNSLHLPRSLLEPATRSVALRRPHYIHKLLLRIRKDWRDSKEQIIEIAALEPQTHEVEELATRESVAEQEALKRA